MPDGFLQAGVITAIVTPFLEGGAIDWDRLGAEADILDRAPADGICAGGVLGDSAGMAPDELFSVCEAVRSRTRKPLFAMIFPDTESEGIEMARAVVSGGATAIFLAQPHYLCQPEPEGLAAMFVSIRDKVGVPLLLANCLSPSMLSRAGIELLIRERAIDGILQGGDIHLLIDLLGSHCGLPVYSGVEDLHYVALLLGAAGVVSDLATVFPSEVAGLYQACREGRHDAARKSHETLARVWRALDHPYEQRLRLRAALAARGRDVGAPRSPYDLKEFDTKGEVRAALQAEGLVTV